MELEYIIPRVLLLAIFAYFAFRVGKALWSCIDHSIVPKNAILLPNAKIVDVRTEKVQYTKNGMKYKTTVTFSDGFKFVTHETERDDHAFSYSISISPELHKWIIESATTAHNDAIKRHQFIRKLFGR